MRDVYILIARWRSCHNKNRFLFARRIRNIFINHLRLLPPLVYIVTRVLAMDSDHYVVEWFLCWNVFIHRFGFSLVFPRKWFTISISFVCIVNVPVCSHLTFDRSPITGNGLCDFLVLRKSNVISPINSGIQLKHYLVRQLLLLLLLLFVKIIA